MEGSDCEAFAENASDNEFPDEEHSKLLKAINQLDSKQRIKPPTRNEPSLRVSEFNLAPIKGSNVQIRDLAKSLESRGKPFSVNVANSLRKLHCTSHTLPKPLEKHATEKIQRSVGYNNLKQHISRWEATVEANRAQRSLSFPLNLSPVRLETTRQVVKTWKSQTMTPLEAEINEILGNSKVVQEEAKAQEIYKLTLAELKGKRKEMAKIRAQQSYFEAKARRLKRIKSKKYHRIQRREQMHKQLKDFETLQKTDPEAALKQLEQLEKSRAEERMTLRHRNTGQWARSRLVRAKYDPQTRVQLAEQLAQSRDLTKKARKEDSSDEEADGDQNAPGKNAATVDPNNPWMTVQPNNEIEEFVSGYRKYWEDQHKKMKEGESKADVKGRQTEMQDSSMGSAEPVRTSKGEIAKKQSADVSEINVIVTKTNNSISSNKKTGSTVRKCPEPTGESETTEEEIEEEGNSSLEKEVKNSVKKKTTKKQGSSVRKGPESTGKSENIEEGIQKEGINSLERKAKNSVRLIKKKTTKKPQEISKNGNAAARKSEMSVASNKRSECSVNEKTKAGSAQSKRKVQKLKDGVEHGFPSLENSSSLTDGDENTSKLVKSHKKKSKIVENVEANVVDVGKKKKKMKVTEKNTDKLELKRNKEEKVINTKNGKTRKRKRTTQMEKMFDQAEAEIANKIKKKVANLKQSFKDDKQREKEEQTNILEAKDHVSLLALPRNITQPNEDSALDEAVGNRSGLFQSQKSVCGSGDGISGASNGRAERAQEDKNIDPSKFIQATPKLLITAIPDLVTGGGDEAIDDDEPFNQQLTIAEAFADDDVVDDFRKEKEDAVNKSKPQDIDLTLPGWGSWGGEGIAPKRKRRRRFIIKAPNPPPRKDQNRNNVIIDEEKATRIPQHQVSELPFPFTSVRDFEASIRAPLGRTWMPQTAHQVLIQPKVVTKSGVVIKPMDDDMLVNKKATKIIEKENV